MGAADFDPRATPRAPDSGDQGRPEVSEEIAKLSTAWTPEQNVRNPLQDARRRPAFTVRRHPRTLLGDRFVLPVADVGVQAPGEHEAVDPVLLAEAVPPHSTVAL